MSKSEARWKPAVTVAAIVEDGAGRYLLVEEETAYGLRLNNPGGHLEPGESPAEGVVREALEEAGRHFQPEAFLGVYLACPHEETYVRLAFCGRAGEPIPGRMLDTGIVRTLWMTLAEVRASTERHRSPLVLQCIADHAAGRRLPLDAVFSHASALERMDH